MKSWFNAKNDAGERRQRNREYTTRHEEVMGGKFESMDIRQAYLYGKWFGLEKEE